MDSYTNAAQKFISAYKKDTPTNLKIIDIYLAYIMLSGIFQFIYMATVGTFPYNAFLAGFISTVGSFVLAGIKERINESICCKRVSVLNSQSAHTNQWTKQRNVRIDISRTVSSHQRSIFWLLIEL